MISVIKVKKIERIFGFKFGFNKISQLHSLVLMVLWTNF